MSSSSHWVESLFPVQYTIGDYRASFVPDHQRIRRYITTLSAFDAPALAAIYEQSYLFSLIQRLAQQEEESQTRTTTTRSNQTEPIDSVLDIRLIRAFLEKHKEQETRKEIHAEALWSSEDLATIRSVYMTARDDCLRYKSENDYYRQQIETLQSKLDETMSTLETVQNEHRSLEKTHTRWTIRANAAEQLVDEQRRELTDFTQHVEELTKQNENFRREYLRMQSLVLERHNRVEHLERKIQHYDETLKQECDRRIHLAEQRVQIDQDRHTIKQKDLQTKLDKEQELRRQNLLALDQLRKHVALSSTLPTNEQLFCDIKHVKYV